jgi:hypothetical protein
MKLLLASTALYLVLSTNISLAAPLTLYTPII